MISFGGLGCCIGAAALYWLSRICGRDAELVKSALRVNQLKELAKLLDTERKISPLIVAISGRVSSKTPIDCKYSGLKGVIVEEKVEQLLLKRNNAGSWIEDSASLLSTSQEVPWYLDDGSDQVYVVGAQGASGFLFTVRNEVLEKPGRSLIRATLDYFKGLKVLGVKCIERVLPVDTSLTVVGEAVKNDNGIVQIQHPHEGPFYVYPRSLDELIRNLGKWARWCKYGSMALTVLGVFLISKHAILYIMERKRLWEPQYRTPTDAAERSEQENEVSNRQAINGSNSANREHPNSDLCIICLDDEYNVVFLPCAHMCCCTRCSSNLEICPLCRRQIDWAVKTYRH